MLMINTPVRTGSNGGILPAFAGFAAIVPLVMLSPPPASAVDAPPGESRQAAASQGNGVPRSDPPPARRPSPQEPQAWHLPMGLGEHTEVKHVTPAVQKIHPGTDLHVFEYRRAGAPEPLAFAFAGDTSATLRPFRSSVFTCSQTTFGATVEDVSSHDGLLLYEFHKVVDGRNTIFYGAQWMAEITDGEVTLTNPTVPRHEEFSPGTRLISYQVLSPNRRLTLAFFGGVRQSLAREYEVRFEGEPPPQTWIKDATLERDRLVADIVHRGLPSQAEIKIKIWPRTYDVDDFDPRIYRVPVYDGANVVSVRLPWSPGACSLEVTDGAARTLSFLQREVVPLGETELSESTGVRHIPPGAIPLLGRSRGVRAIATRPAVYLPFGSFKQRAVRRRGTRGLLADVDLSVDGTLRVAVHEALDRPAPQAATMDLDLAAGRHQLEIPWEDFNLETDQAYGVSMVLETAEATTAELAIRQAAIATDVPVGRYLTVADWTFDFADSAPELAAANMRTHQGVSWPLYLPSLGKAGTARSAGRMSLFSTGDAGPVELSIPVPSSARTTLTGFHPDDGWIRTRATRSADRVTVLMPDSMLNRRVAFTLGPPQPVSTWRYSLIAAVVLFGSILIAVQILARHQVWRAVRSSMAAALLAATVLLTIVVAAVVWTVVPDAPSGRVRVRHSSFAAVEPIQAIGSDEEHSTPMLTVGSAFLDPIAATPTLPPSPRGEKDAAEPRSETAFVWADFSRGRLTTLGGEVGGYSTGDAACHTQVVRTVRQGRQESVLQVSTSPTKLGRAGIYVKNPDEGIMLSRYGKLQFDAQTEGASGTWVLELKRNQTTIANCRVVIAGGTWQTVNVPLVDLVRQDAGDLGFDELVFTFERKPTRVLIDNLRLSP